MLNALPDANSENGHHTIKADASNPDDTITGQAQVTHRIHEPSLGVPSPYVVSLQHCASGTLTAGHKHSLIAGLKRPLKPRRQEFARRDSNDHEKNNGYLLIDQPQADPVFISDDYVNRTRHAESCEHEPKDGDSLDIHQIHFLPTTPATPNLLPPQREQQAFYMSAVQLAASCKQTFVDRIHHCS